MRSQIPIKLLQKITSIIGVVFLLAFLIFCFEVYVPLNPSSHQIIIFTVEKGWGIDQIADNLKIAQIIRSAYFFKVYSALSLKHFSLQAGEYNLSAKMSLHQVVNKMAQGDIIKDKVIILEGWDARDIGEYLESENLCTKDYFVDSVKKNNLEGYIFPDTYEISKMATCEDIIELATENFEKKLTQDLRDEIKNQKKSIFDIITMASLLEKEVKALEDKKIVSGILWKRIEEGMPLQLDCTINYITGKSDPSASLADTKIDSPYNTYKYYGLPKGPISNPGINSIIAAIYPVNTDFWYYLGDGTTIFSKTLEEHNEAKAKYLGK